MTIYNPFKADVFSLVVPNFSLLPYNEHKWLNTGENWTGFEFLYHSLNKNGLFSLEFLGHTCWLFRIHTPLRVQWSSMNVKLVLKSLYWYLTVLSVSWKLIAVLPWDQAQLSPESCALKCWKIPWKVWPCLVMGLFSIYFQLNNRIYKLIIFPQWFLTDGRTRIVTQEDMNWLLNR